MPTINPIGKFTVSFIKKLTLFLAVLFCKPIIKTMKSIKLKEKVLTNSLISKNREAMDKIVDLLIEKETLDGEEFVNILSKFTTIPEKERSPQLLT